MYRLAHHDDLRTRCFGLSNLEHGLHLGVVGAAPPDEHTITANRSGSTKERLLLAVFDPARRVRRGDHRRGSPPPTSTPAAVELLASRDR